MNKKTIAYRQGDLAFVKVLEITKGLKELKTDILLKVGSSGNPHTFKGGKFYPKIVGQFILGYLKAKKTRLFHNEHGSKTGFKLPDGLYEIRRQSEDTIGGLKQVID